MGPEEPYCLDYINPEKEDECVKYGETVHFQMSNTSMWLKISDEVDLDFVSIHSFNQREMSAYELTIRSSIIDDERIENEPRNGECVHFQDEVFLQVNDVDNRWLTGGRGSRRRKVTTLQYLGNRWIVRRNVTTGDKKIRGSREDDDVTYDDGVYLQVNNVNNRWLTGGHGKSENLVRTAGYTYANEWIVRKPNMELI